MKGQKNFMLDMILLLTLIIRKSHRTGVSTFAPKQILYDIDRENKF